MTSGQGVDCVLNQLSGELLRVSFDCLATFGKFIEFGARDIMENTRMEMQHFSKSATFTFLDISTLVKAEPAAIDDVIRGAFALLQKDITRVVQPLQVFPAGEVEAAFRSMQQNRHCGKVVLSFHDGQNSMAPVLSKARNSLVLNPSVTYLPVGGLGGLGRSLAKDFVASGARNLAFLSRSGDDKPEAQTTVTGLKALGVRVEVLRGDVADPKSFSDAMELCPASLPPVRGVVHMAIVLGDALVENMSYVDWKLPLRPKVQGTWNLHEYFNHERQLDFMVFCSSFSGLCGSPGQAQYGGGNTYQDALAHIRRDQGLKAVSVNLGIMLSVGILAEMGTHTFKQWEDALGIREPAFLALIRSIINGQQNKRNDGEFSCPGQISLGLGHADIIQRHSLPNPPCFSDPRFGPLTVASSAPSEGANVTESFTAQLSYRLTEAGKKQDGDLAKRIVVEALVAKLADILSVPASEIDSKRPLYSYGVDPLVALEVRNWVTREMKANMALLDILAEVPMEEFARQIAEKSKFFAA